MKLTALDRDYLRRGLQRHPETALYVSNVATIDAMPTKALLSLAKKLNVDVEIMIKVTEGRDHALQEFSHKHPAFQGTYPFELTIEVLGKPITRKAKAEYTYTPEWEYFDLQKNELHVGWPGSSLQILIRTVPAKDGTTGEGPSWEAIDILDVGEVWNVLEDAIEEQCKIEDVKRRRGLLQPKRSK